MDGMNTSLEIQADADPRADEKPAGTDLVQRATVDELLGWRGRAIELAHEARDMHVATLAKIKEAAEASAKASPTNLPFHKLWDYVEGSTSHSRYSHRDEPDKFSDKVRQDIDRHMWHHLLRITGIEGLMDEQAIKEFEQQLSSDPPEITIDNIRATFKQFKEDAHTIFRRGLVNAFTNLDRTYRSHDGFKIGNRLVRSYAMSDYGSIWDSVPVLRDVDRIMHVLDGVKVKEGWSSPLVAFLERGDRGGHSGIRPGSVTTEYWHVKWFKNRNMHLYPLRKDLVRRANRLIAEHFDEALGAGPDAAGARRYERAKPHHSDVEDFYPTPEPVVAGMIRMANLKPSDEVLEPSAGDGAIVRGLMEIGINPDCVEIHPDRADILRDMLPPGCVVNMDFLKMHPEPDYDCVMLNPPFGKNAGVAHVFHAVKFLKPGGRLVAILGIGMEYREDGPTVELRNLIKAWNGSMVRLRAGSFSTSGTNVETVMITMTKPMAALPAPVKPDLLSAAD